MKFNPNARLDTSQITDLRAPNDPSRNPDRLRPRGPIIVGTGGPRRRPRVGPTAGGRKSPRMATGPSPERRRALIAQIAHNRFGR